MQPAVYLKRTIDFNKGFRQILEVMKLVAVSQYHTLEKKIRNFEELEALVPEFFNDIDLTRVNHPFINPGPLPLGVLAVTSDAGLLGGINMQVMTKAAELVHESNGKLIVVGDRGAIYAQNMDLSFTSYPGVQDDRRLAQAFEVRDFLSQKVKEGVIGPVKVVYPHALSFTQHKVEVATLLPFKQAGQADNAVIDPKFKKTYEVIFESTPANVVEYLVFIMVGQRLFEIFGVARLCEHAARFTHLEESCQKIQEMNNKLLLQYFRRRHEIIDANMRELYAARSTYAK